MAQLTYEIKQEECPDGQTAAIVELAGSVDPSTIEVFDGIFDELIEAGHVRIAIDMAKLKYINSTGMGMMVQYVDQLVEEGGGLVLMSVQPKVQLVLEMLGLQELFQIVASGKEALTALAGEDVAPSHVQVRFEEEDEEEEEAAPAAAPAPAPAAAPILAETPGLVDAPAAGAPITIEYAGARLLAPGPGSYRCPRTGAALVVADDGSFEAYPESAERCLEATIPAADDYYAGATTLVAAAGKQAGLGKEDAKAMVGSLKGCLKTLAAQALNGSSDQRIHLFVRSEPGSVTVRIYCAGKALAGEEAVAPFQSGVDKLEWAAVGQGNLLTLSKSGG